METRALIELLDRDGSVRHVVRVFAWPVRIGRAIDCDVVIDDAHVAAHHASLLDTDQGLRIVAEPTVNGVRLGRRRLAPGVEQAFDPAAVLTLGATQLRVRVAGEALAEEQPLGDVHGRSGLRALGMTALALIAALWVVLDQWLGATPGTPGLEMTSVFLGVPIVLAAWCGLWALGSKLFQRHFAFWPHLQAALVWLLLGAAVRLLGQQLAFAFSLPALATLGGVLAVCALAVMFWRHLALVLPARRRVFGWMVSAMLVAGFGLDMAARHRHEQPLLGDLYLSALSPPAMRVARPVPVDRFVDSLRPLEQSLGRWAKDSGDDNDSADGDED